jgi:ParB family chromosome partitioning protein
VIKKNTLSEQFAEIGIYQELDEARQRIEQLVSEVTVLREARQEAGQQEKLDRILQEVDRSAIQKVILDLIEPNPQQGRKTFTKREITSLGRSLERDGQNEPILIYRQENGRYLLFDGERRWRAAREIGWSDIEVVILPIPAKISLEQPETIRRKTLISSRHKEKLNALDLAESLIAEIEAEYRIAREQIPTILNSAIMRFSRAKQLERLSQLVDCSEEEQVLTLKSFKAENLLKSPEENQIFAYLLSLQLNPASVAMQEFQYLNLLDDLKLAIRKRDLKVTHAKFLQRLTAAKLEVSSSEAQAIREQIIQEIVAQDWSIAKTRQRVNEILNPKQPSQFSQEIETALASITKIKVDAQDDPEALKILEVALKKKLKEISKIIKTH